MLAGLLQPLTYGRGYPLPTPVAAPAAGAVPAALKVTGGYWWRVVSFTVALTTSATVANRTVFLDYRDGDNNLVFRAPAGAVQAASLTVQYSFGIGYDAAVVAGLVGAAPVPGLFLQPGWRLAIGVSAIDATDQLSAGMLIIEQFVCGDDGYPLGAVDDVPLLANL